MKYKKIMFMLVLAVFLLSITCVSASEIDDTLASEDTNTIGLSVDNDIIEDNLQTSEENDELALTDNDETLSAKNDTDVLSDNSGTYSGLSDEIGSGGNIELKHDYYTYDDTGDTISISFADSVIDGKGAIINMTGSNIRAFYVSASGVTIKNLTIINANYDGGDGGAIYFSNSATSGTVTNCNFVDNKATGDYSFGGAIRMSSGTVSNCNFTGNTAGYWGGAVYLDSNGEVTNCSFTDNTATYDGGAVYFMDSGNVTNCSFTNNTASRNGGAVWIYSGTVSNCNFADNTATIGGAINMALVTVSNCNFVDNTANRDGGAIRFSGSGTVTNCNFTNNTATYDGGAVYFLYSGTVSNCNFTGNNATTGSAIYFYSTSATKTVFNSRFLNNRANAEALEITKNDNNITITFTGRNNLLNAIYSSDDAEVAFNNVTYWGAKGITTVSATMSGSNKATGQNITVSVVVNGKVVLNEVNVTDDNGMIVLPIIAGENYYISARHDTDSYYTEAEKTITNNTKFNVNVTSQTTNNKTVNITAKSNIPQDVVQGKLLFILPNGTQINATYGANGTWWAEHTFDDYDEYKVNASYVGLDNVTVNNGTITINKVNSTITLDNIVLDYGESANVTVTTTGATGITANINGTNVTVINNYTIPISDLAAGNYTLTVTTIPDNNHNPITKEATITVNKLSTEITLANETLDLKVNDEFDVLANLTPAGAGNLTYSSSNESVVKVSDDGLITALGNGTSTVTVSFAGNDNYTAAKNKTISVTVSLKDASVSAEDITLDVGANATVNVTVVPEGLEVTYVPDNSGVVTVENGVVTAVKEGTAKITLTVGGDGVYALNSTTIAVAVKKIDTSIDVDQSSLDLYVNDNSSVSTTLTPADAGNVTFTSTNSSVVTVDSKGNVKAVGAGKANITVSFAGDDKYNAAENKTVTVTVSLKDASVSAEDITLDVGANATITSVTVPEGLNVTYVPDNSGVVTVENGVVTAVKEGTAKITLTVGGDGVYAENSTVITVTVNKLNTTAEVSIPENITVGDNSTVNVVLPSDATGNVTVKVDGEIVDTVPVKDGTAEPIIPSLGAGNHTVEIAYSGDGKYNPVNETKDVTVSKNDVTPEITIPSDIEFGDDATIDVKLPSDAKGNVTLTVDGKVIDTVPVVNGAASVKLPNLNAGNHTAEIAYSGDDKYKSTSKTTTVSVAKDSTKITVANVTATYKVNKYLVITLKDSKGNPLANSTVTVDLNGVKNYTTDENGQVNVKVSNLVPKTYSAKITFAGNDNYLGSDATAKVVVKKATPKITASNKMFKTTAKTKKYTITLKDNTGKAIKNAKVTLKVNGKTYKATTNSKGKATFKITKLNKKGTFKAVVTYKGSKYYNKVTKKVNIKVISAWKTVSKGSKLKSTVKEIQRALKNNGYYLTAYGHYLMVDGIYGDCTVRSVKEFQHDKGLKVTGKVDEKTAKKLGLI